MGLLISNIHPFYLTHNTIHLDTVPRIPLTTMLLHTFNACNVHGMHIMNALCMDVCIFRKTQVIVVGHILRFFVIFVGHI